MLSVFIDLEKAVSSQRDLNFCFKVSENWNNVIKIIIEFQIIFNKYLWKPIFILNFPINGGKYNDFDTFFIYATKLYRDINFISEHYFFNYNEKWVWIFSWFILYMSTINQESFISDRKALLEPTTKGQLKTLFVESEHLAFLCENHDSKADLYPFFLTFSHHKSIHNLLFIPYLSSSLSLCFSLLLWQISLLNIAWIREFLYEI